MEVTPFELRAAWKVSSRRWEKSAYFAVMRATRFPAECSLFSAHYHYRDTFKCKTYTRTVIVSAVNVADAERIATGMLWQAILDETDPTQLTGLLLLFANCDCTVEVVE